MQVLELHHLAAAAAGSSRRRRVCSSEAWISTPGHGADDRRRLDVAEAGGRGADEHDVALRAGRRGTLPASTSAARTYWSGSRQAVADPGAALRVDRDATPAERDPGDAAGAAAQEHLVGADREPQRLEGEAGQELAADRADQRHPADDPVDVGGERDQPEAAAASPSTGIAPTSPGSSGRKRRGSSPTWRPPAMAASLASVGVAG